jgi:hypothetical protein
MTKNQNPDPPSAGESATRSGKSFEKCEPVPRELRIGLVLFNNEKLSTEKAAEGCATRPADCEQQKSGGGWSSDDSMVRRIKWLN